MANRGLHAVTLDEMFGTSRTTGLGDRHSVQPG
jgi:hypothetical protein